MDHFKKKDHHEDKFRNGLGGATWLHGPPKNFKISPRVCKKITWAPPKVNIRPPHIVLNNLVQYNFKLSKKLAHIQPPS